MIELSTNNPYANGAVIEFPDGTQKLERTPLDIQAQEGDDFYTVRKGDRLEQLAWLFWNTKVEAAMRYWWVIKDANKIKNPLDLTDLIGTEILIPDILRIKIEYDI
jgi:hypothetical protein